MGKLVDMIINSVFPTDIYCICCGSVIDGTRTYSLCDDCISKFEWAVGRTCTKCGRVLQDTYLNDFCGDCLSRAHWFDKGYTCCGYELYERAVVMDMKYRDMSYICRVLGDMLADRMNLDSNIAPVTGESTVIEKGAESGMHSSSYNGGSIEKEKYETVLTHTYDFVLPVPISDERKDERGYNQAELMATRFCERTGLTLGKNVLVRISKTTPMKDLDRAARFANVHDAFEVTEHGQKILRGTRCIIIDDIYTTGATLDECARVLKQAGSSHVDILTFAAGRNRPHIGAECNADVSVDFSI